MNESALKNIRAHIAQTPQEQHKPLTDGELQVVTPVRNVAMPLPPDHRGSGESAIATHKLEFAKRVTHFRRLFAGEPTPQVQSVPPRVHGKATQTGRKLSDRPTTKPLSGPHFVVG